MTMYTRSPRLMVLASRKRCRGLAGAAGTSAAVPKAAISDGYVYIADHDLQKTYAVQCAESGVRRRR